MHHVELHINLALKRAVYMRIRIIWLWLSENARGLMLGFGIFAALLAPVIYFSSWRGPVVEETIVDGTVLSLNGSPLDPSAAVGRGFSYRYLVELSTGIVVQVSDGIAQPHPVGRTVRLQQFRHEGGGLSYRFLNEPSVSR